MRFRWLYLLNPDTVLAPPPAVGQVLVKSNLAIYINGRPCLRLRACEEASSAAHDQETSGDVPEVLATYVDRLEHAQPEGLGCHCRIFHSVYCWPYLHLCKRFEAIQDEVRCFGCFNLLPYI